MKLYITMAGVLLAVLNAFLLFPAIRAYTVTIAALGLLLALLIVALSAVGSTKNAATPEPASTAVAPPAPTAIQPPASNVSRAETEVVALIGLLQEKGRLVDFLMEEITSYDDAQVGAAARVIHQGCRQVLQEHFKITAVSEAAEGSQVSVPAEHLAEEYRIVGKLSGDPPFIGKLIHKGWKTESVKLPRTVQIEGKPRTIIAPAEVEVK